MKFVGIDIHYLQAVQYFCRARRTRSVGRGSPGRGELSFRFRSISEVSGRQIGFVIEASWHWGKIYDLLEEIDGVEEIVLAHPFKTRLIADAQI